MDLDLNTITTFFNQASEGSLFLEAAVFGAAVFGPLLLISTVHHYFAIKGTNHGKEIPPLGDINEPPIPKRGDY